jgi:hypothetical protein
VTISNQQMGNGTNTSISVYETGHILAGIVMIAWKNALDPIIVQMIELPPSGSLQGWRQLADVPGTELLLDSFEMPQDPAIIQASAQGYELV